MLRKRMAKARTPEPPRRKVPPPRPPDQVKAIEEFEAALRSLQKRDFAKARDQFRAVIEKHPGERELSERSRSYIQICERSLQPPAPRLHDANDYYQHGIFLMNRREMEEAGRMFEKALSLEPDNARALYGQAACLALSGRAGEAIGFLRRAIALDPTSRAAASRDSDFDGLRDHEEFMRLTQRGTREPE